MKHNKLYILSLLALFSACQVEEQFGAVDSDLIPLNISGSVNQVPTKATADGFVNGDALGLFAVNYLQNNTVVGSLVARGNQADNVRYVFDEQNQKWNPVHPVYYKDINTHVDLYVYYPYAAGISDVAAYNFEVKQDQSAPAQNGQLCAYEASDFMWCKATDITPSESRVRVILDHKLAGVNVILSEGTGFAEGEFESLSKGVLLNGTTRKASIDFSTGVASPIGSAQQTGIVMAPQEDGSFRAVVIPQTVAGGTKLFSITIDGISYSYSKSSSTAYESGKMSQFTLTLNKKTPAGDYELVLTDAQILPWTEDRNTHGGEARQYYVVNVETPGTLQAVIEAAGKNPAKIKNLKIVGQITGADFLYMSNKMSILRAVNLKDAKLSHIQYYNDQGNFVYDDDILPANAFCNKATLAYVDLPDNLKRIERSGAFEEGAFSRTAISSIVIPDGVTMIGRCAFRGCVNLTNIDFPVSLEKIDERAFEGCSVLSCNLAFPQTLKYIGSRAFSGCGSIKSRLILPDNVTFIGDNAFYNCKSLYGDLEIPEGVNEIYADTFSGCSGLTGHLKLHDGLVFNPRNYYSNSGGNAFSGCHFSGTLVLPSGLLEIPNGTFSSCRFSSISGFPESLGSIGDNAFSGCSTLSGILEFPQELYLLGSNAFSGCSHVEGFIINGNVSVIKGGTFSNCYGLTKLVCSSIIPPSVVSGAFNGVPKDNFAVEVPEASVTRYQTESGWSDFKRIVAHQDFSISRSRLRGLNESFVKTLDLRCPAGFSWSVDTMPDWVSVSPSSGTGKTSVTVTINQMSRTNDTFEVNEGTVTSPKYKNFKGRSGEIVFKLDGKDYSCVLNVEQYDNDREDGDAVSLQSASKGAGIDVVFIGEGYDAKDIANGIFSQNCADGYAALFALEPYSTYKDYFNVYSVLSLSSESGIEDENTIIDNKFTQNGIRDITAALQWAKNSVSGIDLTKTVVIMLENNAGYYGWTYMYLDGSSLCVIPVSKEPYPYDFRGLIQHEAGGHAFGKLGDEYIYHNAYIASCGCKCCEHPRSDAEVRSSYGMYKSVGWFKNLSLSGDPAQVPWSHLIYDQRYSDKVDIFEGGYMHSRGMYRSEATSCMNNNIPYFSAISRQAIVERIKAYAGEQFDFEDFVANDSFAVGTKAAASYYDWTFGVDPRFSRGSERGSVIYMGEHPNVK